MKRLIVTADDVGLHRGLTEGAIRAHTAGIVTACSIVANGAAFEHAVERLRDMPALAVGVHLTLVEERPLAHNVPSLVGSSGLFHESYLSFLPRYLLGRISMADVERELRMQIERVLGTGLEITHVNGHQHLHLLPEIFTMVEHMAEEYRIGYIRIVDEPRRGLGSRDAAIAMLSHLGREARDRSRVATNQRTIGVLEAGKLRSGDAIVALLDECEGTSELVTHPGIGDGDLTIAYSWGYRWEEETAALCDPRVRAAIDARGITLARP